MLVFNNYMKYNAIHFSEIDSTNKYVKENFNVLDDFTFVSTDYQTQGKGRNDRSWLANKNENLMFSLLLKNKDIIMDSLISLVAAVSISEIVERYARNRVEIKWPNDIYISDKKVAGILLEGRLPDYVVIGVGINVNQKEFVGEYRKEPTSLLLETGTEININYLKESVYQQMVSNLTEYTSNKEKFLEYFKNHNYLLNKNVSFVYNKQTFNGIVNGVDESFNIVIKNNGKEYHISSGEIELIK